MQPLNAMRISSSFAKWLKYLGESVCCIPCWIWLILFDKARALLPTAVPSYPGLPKKETLSTAEEEENPKNPFEFSQPSSFRQSLDLRRDYRLITASKQNKQVGERKALT